MKTMAKPSSSAKPKPHPATDIEPNPEEATPIKGGDKTPNPTFDVPHEPDISTRTTGIEIRGKQVHSGPGETRLFQHDIHTKEWLTRDEAKKQGRNWKD